MATEVQFISLLANKNQGRSTESSIGVHNVANQMPQWEVTQAGDGGSSSPAIGIGGILLLNKEVLLCIMANCH